MALLLLSGTSSCTPQDAEAKAQAAVEKYASSAGFEGVIVAFRDGRRFVSFARGRLPDGSRISSDTPMPVGSISKQFCAAAVLRLQDQGKLRITDTLDRFYPDYPEGGRVQLKHLLSMRSGIPENLSEDGMAVISTENTEEENLSAIKEWIFSHPLAYTPGSFFQYCNANYLLLADIVEQVSGKAYLDFLRENFFVPLGMMHTGSFGGPVSFFRKAEAAPDPVFDFLNTQPGLTKGAGDLVSNAEDIRLWLEALAGGKLLSEESWRAMTTDYSPEEHSYGFGLRQDLPDGIGHYGTINIYRSCDYINLKNGLTVFLVSTNVEAIEDFSEGLFSLLLS